MIDTDHPELVEFEGETLGDTLTNLITEVKRLRKTVKTEHNLKLWEEAEVKRLREEIKDYDACLQNLWDKELIPEDTDIWDEVKELLEVD
tara:strand:+ start:899 stop:1168 length:270 start_codon:yes stop_codon:yes gene_type:complete